MSNIMPQFGEPRGRGRLGRLLRRAIWPVVIIAVIALLGVGGFYGVSKIRGNGDENSATEAQATGTPSETVSPEQALSEFITVQLKQTYSGDCTAALMPDTTGLCSAARGDRQDRKAYLVGSSAYDYQLWVFLRKQGNVWAVESTLPVKPETVNAPGAPWPLEKGATVIVGGTGTCLNVRVAPGIKEAAVDCIPDGSTIVLEDGPVDADGYEWWRPEGRSGWVAGDWLRYADETPTTPVAPSDTPTPAG